MKKIICWICDTNYPHYAYTGTKHLDDEGNKPCWECLLEAEEDDKLAEDEQQGA